MVFLSAVLTKTASFQWGRKEKMGWKEVGGGRKTPRVYDDGRATDPPADTFWTGFAC